MDKLRQEKAPGAGANRRGRQVGTGKADLLHSSIAQPQENCQLTHVLNETEQRLAHYLARQRHDQNRTAGIQNGKIGPQDAFKVELEGVGAELAFCRLANIYPDLTTHIRRGGADCLTHRRARVDVKTTSYPDGLLLAATNKRLDDCDVYALLIGSFPGPYRWAGWTWASELLRDENLVDLGYGPVYAMAQDELREPPKPNGNGAAMNGSASVGWQR